MKEKRFSISELNLNNLLGIFKSAKGLPYSFLELETLQKQIIEDIKELPEANDGNTE